MIHAADSEKMEWLSSFRFSEVLNPYRYETLEKINNYIGKKKQNYSTLAESFLFFFRYASNEITRFCDGLFTFCSLKEKLLNNN